MINVSQQKIWKRIVLSIFGIAFCLFAVGLILYILLKQHFPCDAGNITTIYATIAGGLCTLIGVTITIVSEKKMDKDKVTDSLKPDFFMPSDCNHAEADRYTIFKEGTSLEDNSPILNINLYFKNTDKAPFEIRKLKCDGGVYDCKSIYIDKNRLFCISFNCVVPIKNVIEITTKARDGNEYIFSVDESNRNVFLKEK